MADFKTQFFLFEYCETGTGLAKARSRCVSLVADTKRIKYGAQATTIQVARTDGSPAPSYKQGAVPQMLYFYDEFRWRTDRLRSHFFVLL